MDYFALFGLEPHFDLDQVALETRYFELQRELHPDRLKPEDRARALQQSADVNDGYRILKSALTRAQHLLALQGIHVNTEKDTVKPDLALLEEIMEWRERLARGGDDALVDTIEAREKRTHEELSEAFEEKDYASAAHLTLRLNYIHKLLQDAREAV